MNSSKENLQYSQILIIGSGIIGKFNALELSKLGFEVSIIDPFQNNNSSNAALGILMGNIYQKRKGRSWVLREKSLQLWPKWLKEFKEINTLLKVEKPLIKITSNEENFEKMSNFVKKYSNYNLEVLKDSSRTLENIRNLFKNSKLKGIVSYDDGRIDPKLLLNTIDIILETKSIQTIKDSVIKVEKNKEEWVSVLKGGKKIISKVVILCNSLNSLNLVENSKYKFNLQPVLGQAIEISIADDSTNFLKLPKVFSINGKNIIPLNKQKLIIGSTDEYNHELQEEQVEELLNFLEEKPKWLNTKHISKKWFGIRSKPVGEGSPLLKSLEKGLILCSGFYKNGILLAPACSKWISQEINFHI